MACGCIAPWFRTSDKEVDAIDKRRAAIKSKLEANDRPTLIKEIGSDRLLTLVRIENIGLVSQLPNTGGEVRASQPREKMLNTMRRNDVFQPNSYLDDSSTAMVVAFAAVGPGATKGSVIDVSVRLSEHAEAENLQSGWLLETPLVEMMRVGGQVREGFEFAKCEGSIVTRAQVTGSDDPQARLEGVVVGGGRLLKGRELGIGIRDEFAEAVTMAAVLPAINQRFTVFDGRKQTGIATPTADDFIAIQVPKRYELDPYHFVNVVLSLGFNEGAARRAARIEMLRSMLVDPTTVRDACWQLEALGEESLPLLAENLGHPDPEVRFYTAHSMAYLNDSRAVQPLSELCMQQPAFRSMCLNGLAVIDSYEATDALERLLHAADTETRYGAVLALRHRDRTNPQIVGDLVAEVGTILEIPSEGPPVVCVSLHQRPEFVIFGPVPELQLPPFSYINPRIMLQRNPDGTVTISNFSPGKEDRIATSQSNLRSVLQAIAEVGGTYGDWVSFLRECSDNGYLAEPLAMNPIPTSGRAYDRGVEGIDAADNGGATTSVASNSTVDNLIDVDKAAESTSKVENESWLNPMTWWN